MSDTLSLSKGEWKEYKFSDLLVDESISYGIVQPGSHTEVNSVPIIRVNNIKNGHIQTDDVLKVSSDIEDKYKKTRLVGGELLVTVVGSIGECAIVPTDLKGWNVARAVSVARIKEKFDKIFIKYSFLSDDVKFQLYGNTNATVQPTLNLSSLKEIKFRLPSPLEQNSIASILSSLDDKIDLLHRQNKTLEQLAETLFRQWFIEEADESWEEITISEVADHIKVSINPLKYSDTYFFHYSIPSYDEGMEPKLEIGNEILSNKYLVPSNSILISKLNPKTSRIWALYGDIDEERSICSTEFQIVKPQARKWFSFIYCFLKSNQITNELGNAVGGTSGSHQRVDPQVIFDLKFQKPPNELLEIFDRISSEYWIKIKTNKSQIRTLTQLRDTLLPKLMSGEIRVEM